nr:hypothetical protein [Pedobacter sp. ASV2]
MKRVLALITIFLFLILFNALLFSYRAEAQILGAPVNIQSPNAASFGLYGKIPVSFYTGTPNIQIPLYTLQQKEVSIPINLNYHASGLRPDMHPGWVGTGFTLSSGGVVSRIVKDAPDDYSNGNYHLGANEGFYYNHNILNTDNWNQTAQMQGIARGDEMLKDTEPDEFSFNFGDYSGSFYYSSDGNWKVKCNKPLKIKLITGNEFLNIPFEAPSETRMSNYGMSKSFGGFILTTEDGIDYFFGGYTDAIEYSIDFFNQDENEWAAQSWYLTKIMSSNGEAITFTYERDNYINQMYIGIMNDLGTQTKNSGGLFNLKPACSSSNYSSEYHNYNGKLVAPVYLKQINSVHSTIKFNRSTTTELRYNPVTYEYKYAQWLRGTSVYRIGFIPILSDNRSAQYPQYLDKLQWKQLDQIRIEDKEGGHIKTFAFKYTNNINERLRLLSVTEQKGDQLSMPPYTFSYDESVALPGYLSNMVDHWGFYNGTYADMSDQKNYVTKYYNYREPVASYLFAGTLNKIIYPTGGITEFTYEPHSYSKRINENRSLGIDNGFYEKNVLAGGLRIRKISSYSVDNIAKKIEKEYFYVSGYSKGADPLTLYSSGVLGGRNKYYFEDYSRSAFNDNGVVYSKSLFSSQSVLPGCINAQGSHVGYSEVIEKLPDGSYTKYKYNNFDNGHGDEAADNILQISRTPYEPYSSTEEERGSLMSEQNYNSNGKNIKSHIIDYIALNKKNEYVRSLKANYANVCSNTAVSVEEGTAYRLYTYSYLPKKETTTLYDSDGLNPLETTKFYNYDLNSRLIKEETIVDSKGQSVINSFKYPYDFPSNLIYQEMVSKNIIAPIIENTATVNNKPISFTRSNYEKFNQNNLLLPKSIEAQIGNNPIEIRQLFNNYDKFGNLLEQQQPNGIKTSYIWGYSKQYPIAKIVNAMNDNKTTLLETSESLNLSINAPNSSKSVTFTTGIAGNLIINPNSGGDPGQTYSLRYSLSGAVSFSEEICVYRGGHLPSGWCTATTPERKIWIPAGTYTMTISDLSSTNPYPFGNFNFYYSGTKEIYSGGTESFYEGFEENNDPSVISSKGHTGDKYWNGNYSINANLKADRNYLLQWWSFENNQWKFNERPFVPNTVLTGILDDIRIFPANAQITTYTYKPLVGMTSSTDTKGQTTYYEYDEFQRLKNVKDQNGNVIKKNAYHYKN